MKDFFDTWKFKILVAVAVFLVGIMAYAGANGRLTAAPQELLGVILTPFQKAGAVISGGVGAVWEKYASIDKVMEQNEQLTAENAELRQQMVRPTRHWPTFRKRTAMPPMCPALSLAATRWTSSAASRWTRAPQTVWR